MLRFLKSRNAVFIAVMVTALVVAACSSSAAPTLTAVPSATPTPLPVPTLEPTPTVTPRPAPTPEPTAPPTPTASPTPTLTPTSTLTPTPTPTVTVRAPPVESVEDEVRRLTERAMAHVRWLSETLGPRAPTTPQEKLAAEYIASRFRELGYQTSLQEFPVMATERTLRVTTPVERSFDTAVMTGSGQGEVTASLVFVGLGRSEDFPEEGLNGAIALIRRGQVTFGEKVQNAAREGASGVVVFNNLPGLFNGTLGSQMDLPVLTISESDGEALLEMTVDGPVSATLGVLPTDKPSNNVVAIGGPTANRPIVVLGAHYDSVSVSPGANDNASGTAVLLALAEELAGRETPLEVRFVAFGAEEVGLLGSRHYVSTLSDQERERIVAMVNLDALGQGGLEVGGDGELVGQALDIARGLDLTLMSGREPINSSSDHASFRSAGIPVIFFFGATFDSIHTPNDTIEIIVPEQLGQAGAIAFRLLDALAPDQEDR